MAVTSVYWIVERWRKSSAFTSMNLEVQGAYRNLLDECALRGGAIPNDNEVLAKACGDPRRWDALKPIVLTRFVLTEKGWRNETLDKVIRKQELRNQKQKRYRAKRKQGMMLSQLAESEIRRCEQALTRLHTVLDLSTDTIRERLMACLAMMTQTLGQTIKSTTVPEDVRQNMAVVMAHVEILLQSIDKADLRHEQADTLDAGQTH